MGNACLRGSREVHNEEEDDSESSVSRLVGREKSSSSASSLKNLSSQHQHHQNPHQQQQSFVVPVEMKPAMEILPCSQEGVVRVKLIISTNQMANMINASYKKDDFLESLITSLLKEKGINMPDQQKQHQSITIQQQPSKKLSSYGWKPALESIPEVRSS